MIIAIEGLDGVGKTTVASLIRSTISESELLHTPPRSYYDGNLEVLRNLASPARSLLFYSGVLAISDRMRNFEEPRIMVIDRYLGSVAGMNNYLMPQFGDFCQDLALLHPDLTIELTCEESTRRERLRKRGKPLDPFEILLERDASLRVHVHEHIRRSSNEYVAIDTTRLRAGDVARLCLWQIQRVLPLPLSYPFMDDGNLRRFASSLRTRGFSDDQLDELFQGDLPGRVDAPGPVVSPDTVDKPTGVPATERMNISINIHDSIAPFAIGGENPRAWGGDNSQVGRKDFTELVQDARQELMPYLTPEQVETEMAEGVVSGDVREALDYLERIAADRRGYDSEKANWALRVLEPLLISAAGSATYAGLAQVIGQIV